MLVIGAGTGDVKEGGPMTRGRLLAWLLGPVLVLAGCAGAPKGEGGKVFSHRSADSGHRSTPHPKRRTTASRIEVTEDTTRRAPNLGYRSTPDFGTARGSCLCHFFGRQAQRNESSVAFRSLRGTRHPCRAVFVNSWHPCLRLERPRPASPARGIRPASLPALRDGCSSFGASANRVGNERRR